MSLRLRFRLRPFLRVWAPFLSSPPHHLHPFSSLSFPTTSTCTCPPAPHLPSTHPLTTAGLHGAITAYTEQIIIPTGHNAWPSRIEDGVTGTPRDTGDAEAPEVLADGFGNKEWKGRNLAGEFKALLGRKGEFFNPSFSILNSSLPSPIPSAYLLPSFTYHVLPTPESLSPLIHTHLLPLLHPPSSSSSSSPSPSSPAPSPPSPPGTPVTSLLILTCGHASRDIRCALYGPLLTSHFTFVLSHRYGIPTLTTPPSPDDPSAAQPTARTGMISHIGGHKYAGNVIIYIPPGFRKGNGDEHPLAGCGVWYGRVDPEHVEGIVDETILKGNVIQQFFRGGINTKRQIIRG